jgi:translation elongation factor EF-Tu-like GTPase
MAARAFRMEIVDVFWLEGRPFTLVLGATYQGDTAVGDTLELVSGDGSSSQVRVRAVEFVCRRPGVPNDSEALTLGLGDGLARHEVRPGQMLIG